MCWGPLPKTRVNLVTLFFMGKKIRPCGLIDPSSMHCWPFGTANGPWSVLFTSIATASVDEGAAAHSVSSET